jgi:hypothetical protein
VKKLFGTTMAVLGVATAGWAAGMYAARRLEDGRGFAEADDFRVAAVWGGREFESTAASLRTGWVKAVLGGVALDLRGAALHPDGADLRLEAVMGGIDVLVPDGWQIDVDEQVSGGSVELHVPESGSAGAPTLRITAVVRNGGITIGGADGR